MRKLHINLKHPKTEAIAPTYDRKRSSWIVLAPYCLLLPTMNIPKNIVRKFIKTIKMN